MAIPVTLKLSPLSSEPIPTYNRVLNNYRNFMRVHLPFSFLAYRNLLPEKGDDLYFLVWKVNYIFLFRIFLLGGSRLISPFFGYISHVPMALDFLRVGYLYW